MPQDLTDQLTEQGETECGEPAFALAMLAALADHGPLPVPELAMELGVTESELNDELAARGDVTETVDGWCSVYALADGAVLTHLLSADELERGMLAADGDLDLWARLADEGLPLATGGEMRTRYRSGPLDLPPDAATALTGPPGWLSACPPDNLVGLRLTGGAIALESYSPVPPPPDGAVQRLVTIAALLADHTLDEEEEDGLGVPLDEVVLEALLGEPTLLQEPLPPLSVLVFMVGLDLSNGYVALPGADWRGIGRPGGLSRDQRRTLAQFRGTLRRVAQKVGEPVEPGALQPLLHGLAADPDLLGAVGLDVVTDQDFLTPSLAHLAAAAEGGQQRAAAAYLLAVAAAAVGELQNAQDRLDAALTDNSDLGPAVLMAADFAAERGDAFAADRLYRQAGEDIGSPWRSALREFLKAPEGKVGRNHPCPCQSGRKFKLCCGRLQLHPLPRRALWRYRRALAFAMQPARQRLLVDLADTVAGQSGNIAEALADPVVADLAFVEGGLLNDYLEQRGALMPPDEAELVTQWMATPLALLEVVATRPGRELTLRQLPDGEPLVVRDRLMSSSIKPLEMLLGRLLYDGQAQVFLSPPRRMPRERRQSLLALLANEPVDPFTVAAALAPAGPPQIVTREGEQVVMCTARYAVADSMDSAWAALSAGLEDDDGDLIELVDVDGDSVIRGRVRQVSGGLEIETNALERLRRLQQRVRNAAPDARLISESSIPAEELTAAVDGGGLPASGLPPEVERELLESLGEQAEQRWVDEHIPALGGLTPRAAAADPVARAELEALLDDFAWREQQSDRPATMQAARLRDRLGLPPGLA